MLSETYLVAATASVTALLTLALTKGVDAWRAVRKTRLEERQYVDDQKRNDRDRLIDELSKQVKAFSDELKTLREDHMDCVRKHAMLEGKNEALAKEVCDLREEVKCLREWRHGIANQSQALVVAAAEETLRSTKTGSI